MRNYFNAPLAKNIITMLALAVALFAIYSSGLWVYNTYRDFDAMRGYIITQVQKDKAAAARKPATPPAESAPQQ